MDIAVGFLKLLLDILCVWEKEKFALQIEQINFYNIWEMNLC